MDLSTLLNERRDEILEIAARYGASNVRVFGSVARNEAGPSSDVDVLVDLEPGRTLLDHAGLMIALEELLAHTKQFRLAGEIVPTRFPEIGAISVPLAFA